MPKALITGITGQDGSYLADFLRDKRYEIHGLKRRSSSFNTDRVDHLYVDFHETGAKFFLHYADLSDPGSLARCLTEVQPDEVYNLGAQSHVKVSYRDYGVHLGRDGDGYGPAVGSHPADGTALPVLSGFIERDVRLAPPAAERDVPAAPAQPLRLCESVYASDHGRITGKAMACTPLAAFCSTMSRRGGARRLSRRKITRAVRPH